ncbi:hypothetical protein QUF74_01210 [Candidatus Halobeggiatoa sp. HSG11]|nr:hypothetical protein [Candidatus Halobeggiatoa sp. HSG11]
MIADFYMLLAFDNCYLFIPQNEVQSVEIVADIQPNQTDEIEIGRFVGHGLESRVYCLDNDLSLMTKMPSSREFFILLKTKDEEHPLGIVCDEVENINTKQEHLHPQNLHPIMQKEGSPIRQLLFYRENMSCICDGTALVKYVKAQLKK